MENPFDDVLELVRSAINEAPPTDDLQKIVAASALLATCERIVSRGYLPESEERALRVLIVKSSRAFGMPTVAERPVLQAIKGGRS